MLSDFGLLWMGMIWSVFLFYAWDSIDSRRATFLLLFLLINRFAKILAYAMSVADARHKTVVRLMQRQIFRWGERIGKSIKKSPVAKILGYTELANMGGNGISCFSGHGVDSLVLSFVWENIMKYYRLLSV